MDLESVDIAAYSTAKELSEVQAHSEVKLFKGQLDQQEAVMNILLSGIEATGRVPEQTGQRLNIQA